MSECKYKIILFSEENYKGKAIALLDGIDLKDKFPEWEGKAKSLVVVSGGWVLRSAKSNHPEDIVGEYVDGSAQYPSFSERWHGRISALQVVQPLMSPLSPLANNPSSPLHPRIET